MLEINLLKNSILSNVKFNIFKKTVRSKVENIEKFAFNADKHTNSVIHALRRSKLRK